MFDYLQKTRLLFALFVFLTTPLSVQTAWGQEKETLAANDKINKAIESAANFDFDETPWSEIQSLIEAKYKIKIRLDDSALNDSLSPDEPITAKLNGIRLRNALVMMLMEKNATFITQGGELVVCSLDDVEAIAPGELAKAAERTAQQDAEDNAKILEKLKQPIKVAFEKLRWEKTRWREVETKLEEALNLNFHLHRSARDDSLTSEEPVTAKIAGPASQALKTILADKNATFVIKNQVVLIVSRDSGLAEAGSPEDTQVVKVAAGKMEFSYPGSWTMVTRQNQMIEAELKIHRVDGDLENGRMTMMSAGGSVDANIKRWQTQFAQSDGSKTSDKTKTEKLNVAGLAVTLIDISGVFSGAKNGDDFRMLAAIVETEGDRKYFVKLYGPKKTIAKNEPHFKAMIESLKVSN